MQRQLERLSLLEHALAISEQVLGTEHRSTTQSLCNLADVLCAQGDATAARPLLERALNVYEAAFGSDHEDTRDVREGLAALDAA